MGYQKKRIEALITEEKKFDQIGHAVLELWSIEQFFNLRKIIFPHRVGSVTFFGETRDTLLSTGVEIRSPYGVLGHGKNALYYRTHKN